MTSTSHLNYIQCELLVKVSGNTLQLNSDLLEKLQTRWKDDVTVVVLSVLGQPKSRKTFLMNNIINEFGVKFPVPRNIFPYSLDEDDPRYSDFHGEEGILVWQHPQYMRSFGGCTSWLFLDIWQEYPRIEVYKKLVDFCLSMSTTVIFSECCDVQTAEFWSPNVSTMSSGYKTDVMQLHFLIQTNEHPSELLLQGAPSVLNTSFEIGDYNTYFFNKIVALRRISELVDQQFVTTSYVPPAEARDSSHPDNFDAVKSSIIHILESILQHLSPFQINQQVVRLPQVIGCFKICVDTINRASSSSHVQPINELNLDQSMIQANQLKIPFNFESQKLDHPTNEDEDSEMKDVDEISNSFMKVDDTSETNNGNRSVHQEFTGSEVTEVVRQENVDIQSIRATYYNAFNGYFENIVGNLYSEESDLLKHHRSIIAEIYANISGIECIPIKATEKWFEKVREYNCGLKSTFNSLVEVINEEIGLIEANLCTQVSNDYIFTLTDNCFRKIIENVSKDLEKKWHKVVEDIVWSQRNVVAVTVSKIFKIIDTYNVNFEKQFQLKFCFTPQQFEDFQMKIMLDAKLSVNWENSPRNKLNRLLEIMMKNRKKIFHERNLKVYRYEEIVSKEAYEYALEKFKLLLDEKISSTMLTENDLLKIYQHISEIILSAFITALERTNTEQWLIQRNQLEEKFKSLRMTYVQKNKSHLKKIDLIQKESIEIGTHFYRDEMNRNLAECKLSMKSFNHVHASSLLKSIAKFHQKVDQIDKHIWQHWEDQLKNKLHELEKRFAKDNNSKTIQLKSYSEVVNSQQEPLHFREQSVQSTVRTLKSKVSNPNQYGIGLYIDPQQVCIGVYVNQDVEFSENVFKYEPLIGFADDTVFVGEEVLSQRKQNASVIQRFNIFKLLCFKYDKPPYDVYISGKSYKFGLEEILTLYFHRIRKNMERTINARISSCYVAVTGLLTSGSKQLLKTSLHLAGFQTNFLIPCTTAMAISYSLKMRNGDLAYGNSHNTILVYTCDETLEVALAEISEENIKIHKLCGDLNIEIDSSVWFSFWNKLEKKIQRIFQYCAEPKSLQAFVLCNSNKVVQDQKHKTLNDLILQQKHNQMPLTSFKLMKDIIKVAAALDANNKNHPGRSLFRFPIYQTIHPYKLSVKNNGTTQTFVDFYNHNHRCLKLKLTWKDEHITVEELSFDSEKSSHVAKYKFTMPKNRSGREISFSLGAEGNLMVEGIPEDQITYLEVTKSMILNTHQRTSNKIAPLLSAIDQQFETEFPIDDYLRSTEQFNTHATSTGAPNSQEIEDIKKSISALIVEVQQQLYNSSTTTDAVKENITAKVRKCESMINQSDVKVKQLQMERNNLTRAAKLIKP